MMPDVALEGVWDCNNMPKIVIDKWMKVRCDKSNWNYFVIIEITGFALNNFLRIYHIVEVQIESHIVVAGRQYNFVWLNNNGKV